MDDAILDIIIRDKEGVLFQGISKDFGANFGRLPRFGRLLISFTSMPANSAEIRFFFSILSERTGEVFDWKRHVRLKISNNSKLTGRIALNVQWISQAAEFVKG